MDTDIGRSPAEAGSGHSAEPEPISVVSAAVAASVPNADWIACREQLPPIGERVRVRHQLNPSYDCSGEYKGDGRWACENAFIVPPGFLVWNPTHWQSAGEQASA